MRCSGGRGAATGYVVLVVWHWAAWWMLTIYFMLVAVSLAKFFDYKKMRRKTAASRGMGLRRIGSQLGFAAGDCVYCHGGGFS